MNKTAFGRFRVAALLGSSLLFSCGPSGGSIGITSFSATPNPAFQQESVTLSWQISGASSASISPSVGEVNASNGSVQVSPSENTSYTLTAKGTGGSTSKNLALSVQPFGRPQISDASGNPISGLIVGEAKDVIFSVYIKTAGATVKARRGASEIATLLDNGNLQNGDEILGDGVYSGKARLNETSPGSVPLELVFTLSGQTSNFPLALSAVKPLDAAAGQQVSDAHNSLVGKVNTLPVSLPLNTVVSQAADHLKANATALGIASVRSGGDLIEISYASGLQSSVRFEDAASVAIRGPILGGSLPKDEDRRAVPSIPLEQQTRGEAAEPPIRSLADPSPSVETTGGRSVLIYSPFVQDFTTLLADGVEKALKDSKLGFSVTRLQGAAASVVALTNITRYNYVILDTHGDQDSIMTNESVSPAGNKQYSAELASKEIVMHEVLHLDAQRKPTLTGAHYAVTAAWLAKHLVGRFKNSIIVGSFCESDKTDVFWKVFEGRGAGAFFGFSEVVHVKFSAEQVIKLTGRLAGGRLSTGDAYAVVTDPDKNPDGTQAVWQKRGKDNLKFPLGLSNGNFEDRLEGWKSVGDGRALSRISPAEATFPVEGSVMGAISTGLGFTTSSGSIEQSFYVDANQSKLKFQWNFLSEEFLEFIGSDFQDAFKVTVVRGDTNASQDHLNLSINGVAAKFGASKCPSNADPCTSERGSLKKGSPQVVFDKGDVWFTGWKVEEIDLTPYRDKEITLRFSATDVGDSIYDTAVLIDEVRVE